MLAPESSPHHGQLPPRQPAQPCVASSNHTTLKRRETRNGPCCPLGNKTCHHAEGTFGPLPCRESCASSGRVRCRAHPVHLFLLCGDSRQGALQFSDALAGRLQATSKIFGLSCNDRVRNGTQEGIPPKACQRARLRDGRAPRLPPAFCLAACWVWARAVCNSVFSDTRIPMV